jgi:hypothetical protein
MDPSLSHRMSISCFPPTLLVDMHGHLSLSHRTTVPATNSCIATYVEVPRTCLRTFMHAHKKRGHHPASLSIVRQATCVWCRARHSVEQGMWWTIFFHIKRRPTHVVDACACGHPKVLIENNGRRTAMHDNGIDVCTYVLAIQKC